MNASYDLEQRIADHYENEAPARAPDWLLTRTMEAIDTSPQRRPTRALPWTFPALPTSGTLALTVVVIIAVLAIDFGFMAGSGASPTPAPLATRSPSTSPATTTPLDPRITELMDSFLAARITGTGAGHLINGPEVEFPLLYATTSGARYERAEFAQVLGYEWPYGFAAFKVRLFSGDTVVEQLVFTPQDLTLYPDQSRAEEARGRFVYVPDGFGTDIAPTAEDGRAVAMPYRYFDGQVTLRAAHPWIFQDSFAGGRLIPTGAGVRPTTDGGQRHDWDALLLLADPVPAGTGCETGPSPADATALAESIRSDPDLEATAPAAVSVGRTDALMMDVAIAAGASVCAVANMLPRGFETQAPLVMKDGTGSLELGLAAGDRMRLYLYDLPEGSSMRILGVAIVAPESRFERAVEAAAPVAAVEFHVP